MKKYTLLVLSLFTLAAYRMQAQDIHFSMFYASPLTLNPALTGANDGTYRISGIFRDQWASVATPAYTTYALSGDFKLLQDKLKNDIFGIGLLLQGDRSGDGKMMATNVMLSAAFHKGLDKGHKHFIGLGVQFAYTQTSIQWQSLSFPDQYDLSQNGFNLNQGNGENISKPNINNFDMHGGFLYQGTFNNIVGLMVGASIFHIVPPKESFLGQDIKLSRRGEGHLGFHIKAAKNFYINPNFIGQWQINNWEVNVGTAFEYHVPTAKSELVASLGGWYRINDAPIISAGLQYMGIRGMFAYDITTSELHPATNGGRGAWEIGITYTGIIKAKTFNYPVLVPCPMM